MDAITTLIPAQLLCIVISSSLFDNHNGGRPLNQNSSGQRGRGIACRWRKDTVCPPSAANPHSKQLNNSFSYPKHVWSPSGGWYAQPANWKANTAVMAGVIIGITAMVWSISADREVRTKFPEEGRFYPSRWSVYAEPDEFENLCH